MSRSRSSLSGDGELYSKEFMHELKESGVCETIASRVVGAVLEAMDSEKKLLVVLDEVKRIGKPEVASRIWVEHIATLLACIPRKHRRRAVNIMLKLTDAMERELRKSFRFNDDEEGLF